MSVETLDDVIEEILNACGVYGAHGDPDDSYAGEEPCTGSLRNMCRVCAFSYISDRIRKSAEVERLLSGRVVPL